MDASKMIDSIVNQMAMSMGSKAIREQLHRCVDESCDQLNLDSVDAKLDAEEANET